MPNREPYTLKVAKVAPKENTKARNLLSLNRVLIELPNRLLLTSDDELVGVLALNLNQRNTIARGISVRKN